MAKNEETTATATATETESKEKSLRVRMKAALAAFGQVGLVEVDSENGLMTVAMPHDLFDEYTAIAEEIAATAVRGLPVEVRLAKINEDIAAELAKGAPDDKVLEDLFVKKRNLANRNKQ